MKKRKQKREAPPPEDYLLSSDFPELAFPDVDSCFFDFEKLERAQAEEVDRILNKPFEYFEYLNLPPPDFSFLEADPFPPISWGIETLPPRSPKRRRANRRR